MSEYIKPKLSFIEKILLPIAILGVIVIIYTLTSSVVEVVNENNSTDYWGISQEIVKDQLKSPSSAKFPSYHDSFVTLDDGDIVVQSYVEADNSFGVSLRKSFKVVFKDGDFDNYTVSIY